VGDGVSLGAELDGAGFSGRFGVADVVEFPTFAEIFGWFVGGEARFRKSGG
jgi:N-acetylmuramic acid 6-phosphate (MurNAc-6-P) etherase